MRNKIFILGLSLTAAISLSACSKSADSTASTQTSSQQQTAESITKENIIPTGGLGATIDSFNAKYGKNAGNQNIGSYQNGSIHTMVNDNRVTNIQLIFDKTSKPIRTLQEAQSLISTMIPSDAKKINDVKDPKTGEIGTVYESAELAKIFDKNYKAAEEVAKKVGTKSSKPGTFIVQIQQDAKGTSGIIFGLGDS